MPGTKTLIPRWNVQSGFGPAGHSPGMFAGPGGRRRSEMTYVGPATAGSHGRGPATARQRGPVRAAVLALVTVSLYGFWRWWDVNWQPKALGQPAEPRRAREPAPIIQICTRRGLCCHASLAMQIGGYLESWHDLRPRRVTNRRATVMAAASASSPSRYPRLLSCRASHLLVLRSMLILASAIGSSPGGAGYWAEGRQKPRGLGRPHQWCAARFLGQ